MSKKNHDDIDELRGDIEGTRQRINGEIEAIGERLSPGHARAVAKERMHDAADVARHVPGEMPNVIRSNPIPTAMIAVGSGWLVWTAVRRAREQPRVALPPTYATTEPAIYEEGAVSTPVGTESRTRRAKERIGSFASNARGRASEVSGRARERVKGRASELAGRSKERASQVRGRSEDAFSDNPLAFGALAVLTGIGIGMMLPHTRREDRVLGKPRERVVDRARHMAQEAKDVAVHSAKEGMRVARETAKEDSAQTDLPGSSSSSNTYRY